MNIDELQCELEHETARALQFQELVNQHVELKRRVTSLVTAIRVTHKMSNDELFTCAHLRGIERQLERMKL